MGKKKSCQPRRLRMKRKQRLDAAKAWLPKYEGKNIVQGYRKHFGVDFICAFIELETLGVEIDPGYKEKALQAVKARAEARRLKAAEEEIFWDFQDEEFACIIGYTSWGFPYGTRWNEIDDNFS